MRYLLSAEVRPSMLPAQTSGTLTLPTTSTIIGQPSKSSSLLTLICQIQTKRPQKSIKVNLNFCPLMVISFILLHLTHFHPRLLLHLTFPLVQQWHWESRERPSVQQQQRSRLWGKQPCAERQPAAVPSAPLRQLQQQ